MIELTKPPPGVAPYGWWRQQLQSLPNTVLMTDTSVYQFGRSCGKYISFHRRDGSPIELCDEITKGALPLWFALNKFIAESDTLSRSFELACNTVAILDGYKRHDDTVCDEHMEIINTMSKGDRQSGAISHSRSDIGLAFHSLERVHKDFDGILKGECKVKLQDRLERILADVKGLTEELDKIAAEKAQLPTTPHALRQRLMSETLDCLDPVLEILTPLNRNDVRNFLPTSMAQRITLHVSVLLSVRARLKKWRDNPSQRFGPRFKILSKSVDNSVVSLAALKDEVYDHSRSLGVWFFTRTGFVPPPHEA